MDHIGFVKPKLNDSYRTFFIKLSNGNDELTGGKKDRISGKAFFWLLYPESHEMLFTIISVFFTRITDLLFCNIIILKYFIICLEMGYLNTDL
jgi:hypothetical protein